MAAIMMSLGGYKFSINTAAFEQLQRTSEYRWVSQQRLTREPAKQYIGLGDQTIELSGVIYPGEFGTVDQVERMRIRAGLGEPLLMIVAPQVNIGVILGFWVIKQIQQTDSSFLPGGVPRKIGFSLSLGFYGEDAV